MLENNLDDEGVSTNSPIFRKKWSIGTGSRWHDIMSLPTDTVMWNTGDSGRTKTKT